MFEYVPVALSFTSALEDILKAIFNDVLAPVLMDFIDFTITFYRMMFMGWAMRLYMKGYLILLKFLNILEQIFEIFSCSRGVFIDNVATTGVNAGEQRTLLDILFTYDELTQAVVRITFAAYAICFLTTIFAVIKSMGDSIGENKRPVTAVLRSTFDACLKFLMIPLVCMFVIKVAGACTASIITYIPTTITDSADDVTANQDTRICDVVFYLTSDRYFLTDSARKKYISGQNFQIFEDVLTEVNYFGYPYLIAYPFVILMIVVMAVMILQCILRMFALLVLYVVSPFFVALIPLDEGAKFKRWREMFVAFAISTFGPIIAMRFYLALVPFIMLGDGKTSGMIFTTDPHNYVGNLIIKLIFIIGGAYAVWQSQHLMLQLVDPEASQLLQKSAVLLTIASVGTSKIVGGVMGKINQGGAGKQEGGSEGGESEKSSGGGSSGGGGS